MMAFEVLETKQTSKETQEDGTIIYTRSYQLLGPLDATEDQARAAIPVSYHEEHPRNPDAVATRIRASREELGAQKSIWKGEVEYQTGVIGVVGGMLAGTPGGEADPELLLPQINWTTEFKEDYSELADTAGTKYVNTAGDPIEGLQPRKIAVKTCDIVRYESNYFSGHNWDLVVNSAKWQDWEKWCAMIQSIDAEWSWQYRKWKVHYVIKCCRQPWNPTKNISKGMRQKVGGKLVPILIEGVPATTPAWLDVNGVHTTDPAARHVQEFHDYYEDDFALLNLPPTTGYNPEPPEEPEEE